MIFSGISLHPHIALFLIDSFITLGWRKLIFSWRSLLGYFNTVSVFRLLFCFFLPNMRAGIRAAKRKSTFSTLIGLLSLEEFSDRAQGNEMV